MQIDQTIDLVVEYEGEEFDIREIPVSGTVDVSRGYGYMGEGGTVDIDITVGLTGAGVREIVLEHFPDTVPPWAFEDSTHRSILDEIREKAEEHFRCG